MRKIEYVIWKEGEFFVSLCLNNQVSSFGETPNEAKDNLIEALELYYEDNTDENYSELEVFQIGKELVNA